MNRWQRLLSYNPELLTEGAADHVKRGHEVRRREAVVSRNLATGQWIIEHTLHVKPRPFWEAQDQ